MKKTSLALFLSSLLLISGCSFSHKPGNVQISQEKPEDQLKNSAFAISMASNLDAAEELNIDPGGSVTFYNSKDKKWSDIKTNSFIQSRITFDNGNLYYRDRKNDYILNKNGISTTEHPEHDTTRMMLSFPIPNQEKTSVAFHNVGFTDKDGNPLLVGNFSSEDIQGYRWDMIVNQGNTREVHILPHDLTFAVQCEDGSIWGRTDPYSSSPNTEYKPANSPDQILSLYPNFSPEVVDTFEYKNLRYASTLTVCHKQTLYYLTDNFKSEITDPSGGGPDDYSGSSLISYNTETGEFKEKEITGDLAIRMSDDMWHADIGTSMFVHNNHLYWVSGNGSVIKTNLETAQNTKVFEIADYKFGDDYGFLEFKDKYLFQFKFTEGKDADIYRYNLETGEMEKHSKIPDFIEVEKELQFPYDIEIIDLEKMLAL